MRILFTPLLYLKVRHGQKPFLDFGLPSCMAIVFVAIIYFAGSWWILFKPAISGGFPSSFIADRLIALLSALSAFYVAALAAIATFTSPNLDELMAGNPPTLRHGIYLNEPEKLTRRRFLSLLFGYLAFTSFFYTIMLVLAPVVAQFLFIAVEKVPIPYRDIFAYCVYGFATFIYAFFFFQIMSTTFVGLHYLSERISRE